MKLADKFLNLFKAKPITSRKNYNKYFMGGGWGDAISWTHPEEFSETDRKFYTVHGWKAVRPVRGDVLFAKMRSGKTAIFVFISVKLERDPVDMFFAEVGFSQYADSPEEK